MPLPPLASAGPRVLAVCPVDDLGGAEIGLLRLASRLARRGWQITVTSPGDGPLKDEALAARLSWAPLSVGGLRAGRTPTLRALAAWPRTRWLAQAHDLVYLNGVVCGRLLPALGSRRSVLHVHDMVARVPAHWSRASVVLADSRAVADRLVGLEAHVVGCPVELDSPPTAPPWEPDGRPVVAFVGRIEPRKGPLDLIEAAPAIRSGRPGVRITMVGSDPYDSDPDYVEEVRASREVEHYPWVGGAAGMMRHIDVLVAPSRQEPFGTVVAEAMVVGTPVVATRVDGLPEVVEDGVTGILVDPGAPDQLATAVLRVLDQRQEMGRAAARAAQRFDAERYTDRVADLIAP